MKRKEGFVLREVCGEKVIVGEGLGAVDFGKLVSINDTAAWIWDKAGEMGEFDAESMAEALCEAYEVTPEVALSDVKALLDQWQKLGIIA
jgi:hypothetical protein